MWSPCSSSFSLPPTPIHQKGLSPAFCSLQLVWGPTHTALKRVRLQGGKENWESPLTFTHLRGPIPFFRVALGSLPQVHSHAVVGSRLGVPHPLRASASSVSQRPLLALTVAAAWPRAGAGDQGVPLSSLAWLGLCF